MQSVIASMTVPEIYAYAHRESLSDMRVVNGSWKTWCLNKEKNLSPMVILVVGNIPLMYALNHDWYQTLMHTLFGQAILAITAAVILCHLTAAVIRPTSRLNIGGNMIYYCLYLACLLYSASISAAGVLRLPPSMGAARAIAERGSGNRNLPDSGTGWTICRSFGKTYHFG